MHQQPPTAPFSPNRSSKAGQRSGVSGCVVSFILHPLPCTPHSALHQTRRGYCCRDRPEAARPLIPPFSPDRLLPPTLESKNSVEFPPGPYELHGRSKCEGHVMGQSAHHYLIFETAGGFCGIAWNSAGICPGPSSATAPNSTSTSEPNHTASTAPTSEIYDWRRARLNRQGGTT